MSDDGLVRCGWADAGPGPDTELYREYHDHEWGRPLRGGVALFERMSLEAFQSGLSWLIILRKRENFRRAFSGFDIQTVAGYTDADVRRLLADEGIVRNRAKIEATIANARAAADLGSPQDLSELLWSFAPPPRPRFADLSEIPSATAESRAMARELKRRGFRFVGPTTAYALMQATGMVDDHVRACWVPPTAWWRSKAGSCAAVDQDREQ
ncbi:DNA-3-methyladenine glycosylase I [Mycobacterium shinjukuense]|uniref:DNA-3-methyladenine glycosylase I n=1 Tax=Mycobacterium shinjukuense TaxID=398694 RepID=A0A7I7MKY5_9MYCO|nr:DNA-3-methyladenine glycosylase I [Mycobacterium shinjukuense]MCV6986779.1 DNA-3-methyladenine glycosylase I [Mycobacterium shinjukuense]ORB69614.1 3-methyladenine DNA glycosylase [Mycobacterium shinjukuense]BBX72512.1 DNA-3-methyladenine glycosylase I [Mycobacterium shinjukuense]